MIKSELNSFQIFFSVLDVIIINIFAVRILFLLNYPITTVTIISYGSFLFCLNAVLGFIGNLYGRSQKSLGKYWPKLRSYNLLQAFSLVIALTILLIMAVHLFSILFGTLCEVVLCLALLRLIYFQIYKHLKFKFNNEHKILIIGYNILAKKLVEHIETTNSYKCIIGFCEDPEKISELSKYPVLGSIDGVLDICRIHNVTEIYTTLTPENINDFHGLVSGANKGCIRFKIAASSITSSYKSASIQYSNNIPALFLVNEPLQTLSNRILKRAFDILFSSIVLIFINSWLIPLVAILIRLETKGPAFFKQQRSGKGNIPFNCYKFRSMHVNKDSDTIQAVANDKRITKVGRYLRSTNLDEFPQFLNVLLGDMSIVGPRPHMLKHTDEYCGLIDGYMSRHFIKPGITGWAQMNGFRGETKTISHMEKRVQHDLWYMENWKFMLDVKIIAATFISTLRGQQNILQ